MIQDMLGNEFYVGAYKVISFTCSRCSFSVFVCVKTLWNDEGWLYMENHQVYELLSMSHWIFTRYAHLGTPCAVLCACEFSVKVPIWLAITA